MKALLAVEDLRKHFKVGVRGAIGRSLALVRAVDGVSFEIERGQSLGLVGESGCGKSTTARTILGLHRATAGSVRFDGQELTRLSRRRWAPYRRRMQMIFQDPYASLDPRQTVGSILVEPLKIHRMFKPRERKLRALALLDAVGLNPGHVNRYPHEFSGGQRQRIGIARALALEPELIVCDEPVSALDVSIQSQILNLLAELQQRFGLSYLFIAHDLAVVRKLCRRIAVMYLGRVVELAERDALFQHPRHPYTQALLSAVPVPDPEVETRRERIVLGGDVPSPTAPPPGCAFHPRCPVRDRVPEDRCAREVPRLLPIPPLNARLAACHLVEATPYAPPMTRVKAGPSARELFLAQQAPAPPPPMPAEPERPQLELRTRAGTRSGGVGSGSGSGRSGAEGSGSGRSRGEGSGSERPGSERRSAFDTRPVDAPEPAPEAPRPEPKRVRELTAGESEILELIRAGYGERNTPERVEFTEHDDAVIFVLDAEGKSALTVNLTTLERWRADGTIESEEELKRDWLRIEE